jgi:hypothetical protein
LALEFLLPGNFYFALALRLGLYFPLLLFFGEADALLLPLAGYFNFSLLGCFGLRL